MNKGQICFVSQPSPERHPERMFTLGKLAGFNAALPHSCRVIEIGCASGQHLISIAEQYPHSYFLGIDISEDSIHQARDLSTRLGINNIEFELQDLRAYQPSAQEFDYAICHGVYSWIDRQAGQSLLKLISNSLTPEGIAYISHNVLPGWSYRQTIRENLQQEIIPHLSEAQRISEARKLMQSRVQQLLGDLSPESLRLKDELEAALARSDAFILYELLAEEAYAAYAADTFQKARDHGLYFFAEAQPRRMSARNPLFSLSASSSGDPYQLESMHDKICMQSFRGSLFGKRELLKQGRLNFEAIDNFYVCSPLVLDNEDQPDIHSTAELHFFNADRKALPINEPIVKSALLYLRTTWPRPISFSELCDGAWRLLSDERCPDSERRALRRGLYQIMLRNDLEFLSADMGIANRIAEQPRVSRFARSQVEQGWITTLRNEFYPVNVLEGFLIQQLDGTVTQGQLMDRVLQLVKTGKLQPRQDGEVITDKDQLAEVVALEIKDCLESFLEIGLFLE